MPGEFVFSACICCYTSCDFSNILIGCNSDFEECCCTYKCCCAANGEKMPIGLLKEDICKLSLLCCQWGLKKPQVCVSGEGQCLCMKEAASCPFGDKVPKPVCAVCALRCLPGVGFMQPPK